MKLIAAISLDGAIGHDNDLLWHLPEDLKRFKEKTLNNYLIVGKTTFENLPDKVLEERTLFVLSDVDISINKNNVYCFTDKEKLIEAVKAIDLDDVNVYVIGGSQIYEEFIDLCDEAYITWVNNIYPSANKRFPINKLFNDFEIVNDSSWAKSKSVLNYKYTDYKRS
jgi:dihydrofolate reductase